MPTTTAKRWYFYDGDRVIGPISETSILDLANSGLITKATQMSREDDSEKWSSFDSAFQGREEKPTPDQGDSATPPGTFVLVGTKFRRFILGVFKSNVLKQVAVFVIGLAITAGVIFGIVRFSESPSKADPESTTNPSQTEPAPITEADNEAEAIYQQGLKYFEGERFPGESLLKDEGEAKDLRKAEQLFAKAGAMGHKKALYYQGVCLCNRNEEREALPYFRQSAEKGYGEAAYVIGVAYMNGEAGLPTDQGKCLDWLRKSSQLGSADGRYLLATFLLDSPYFDLRNEAITLLEQASNQGHMKACQLLGECFADGVVVDCDPERAVQLFARASLQTIGTPDDGKFGNHPLTAKTSHAQFRNALAYLDGRGLPKNKKNAIYLLQEASQSGHESAKKELARQLKKNPKRKK